VSRMVEPILVHSTTFPPSPRAYRGVPSKIAASPKGDLLVYPSAHVVTLLRAADLSAVHIFRDHRFETSAVRFSPNGELVASGDREGEVFVWQTFPPFEMKYCLKNCTIGEVADIAWSPDGAKLAVVGNGGSASYLELKTGSSGADLTCHNRRIESIAIHPNEKKKRILMASHDSRVSVFDNSKGGYRPKYSHLLTPHTKEVYSVCYNMDGEIFASGGADGRLFMYCEASQSGTEARDNVRTITSIVFMPLPPLDEGDVVNVEDVDRQEVVVYASTDGAVRAITWDKNACVDACDMDDLWENETVGVQRLGLAASPSTGNVFVVNSNGRLDQLRVTDGSLVKSAFGHKSHLKAIDIDLATGVTVTGDNNGGLCIDIGNGVECFGDAKNVAVRGLSILSNDGEGAVICLRLDNRMEVLSLLDGCVLSSTCLPSEPLAISRGKDKVAILCHKHCLLVDTKSKHILEQEELTGFDPVSVAMAPNGLELAIGDTSGVVHIYDITDWELKVKHTLKLRGALWAINAMEYSRNGLYLAVADGSRYVSVYSRDDWTLLVDDWRMHNASMKTVGWSPDGMTLATGAVDRSMIVWRLPQGGKKFDPIVQKCGHIPEALIWKSASEVVTIGEDGCRIHWKLKTEED
ncbi:hypothetical protein PRIPAC_73035, partial [Pristionchus pacificus]